MTRERLAEFWQFHGASLLRALKICFIAFLILWFVWDLALKRPVYQKLYGTPDKTPQTISAVETYINLTDQPIQKATIEGYSLNIKLLKGYAVTGIVGYVDRYTNPLGRFYRNHGAGANLIYDKVAKQDLTIVWGKSAKLDCGIDHAYRMSSTKSAACNDLTNIHTIAATPRIQRALEILKKGDIVTLEGYLIYWDTRLKNGQIMDFKSATTPNEISHQKAGGRISILCKQLFLTQITFDGYTFK